jgi:hypothetical protein
MLRSARIVLLSLSTVILFWGCSSPVVTDIDKSKMSAQETIDSIVLNGMTCESQATIVSMKPEESRLVRDELVARFGLGGLSDIIDNRERCRIDDVNSESNSVENIEVTRQFITNTYTVVFVPELETQSVGWSPVVIYSDGSSYGNMCGPWWEFPKDYIAHFVNVSGAYSSPSTLRIMGLNSYGSCYINQPIGSRVYSDNDIRSCFGYLQVWACGGPMQTSDVRIYHN